MLKVLAGESVGAPAEPSERERARLLTLLTVCHAINDFYGMLLPVLLPILRTAFGLSYGQAGVIPFVSTAFSAVFQPVLGYAADRRQMRREFMAAGFLLFAISVLWLSTVQSYTVLIVAGALLGLSGAVYHPQSATFLVHYFRANRGFAQGIHGIGNGIGFAVAPLAFALLATTLGWEVALRVLAVPAVVAAAIVLVGLREPPMVGSKGILSGVTGPLALLTVINGLAMSVAVGFITWLPSYYNEHGFALPAAGALTALMAASAFVAQPLGGRISDRIGRRNVVTIALLGMAVFQAIFVVSPTIVVVVACSLLAGFFGSLLPPVSMVYASELAAGQRTGTAVGVVWGLGTAISSASPVLTGSLIDAFGFGLAYAALAVVAIVGAALSRLLPAPTQPPN